MFFRKRMSVPEFLERRCRELIGRDGILVMESFFDEYTEMKLTYGYEGPSSENGLEESLSANREHFINSFIGTLLWLIKYRALGNMFNSPRKLAFLDLTFDTASPDAVDKTFLQYDTAVIKETYDIMDIGCKKAYTGELQKEGKPRFLISPIWARNANPHPFRVAARLFIQIVETGPPFDTSEETVPEAFIDALEKRFMEMTRNAAEAAKRLNII